MILRLDVIIMRKKMQYANKNEYIQK